MNLGKVVVKRGILEEFNFVAGGYYNAILDKLDISEFPQSYRDFRNQIYGAIVTTHPNWRFAGSAFINAYIDKLSREDCDVHEIAEHVGWVDYPPKKES